MLCAQTFHLGDNMTTTAIDTADQRPSEYSGLSVAIHWLIFCGLIALFVSVNYAQSLDKTDPLRSTMMDWHKAIGVAVLCFAVLRLLWIRIKGAPALVPTTRVTDVLAHISHGLLYLLLLALPLTGLGMTLAAGRGVTLLGIPPVLTEANKPLAGLLHSAHEIIFVTTAALVCIHVAAALWHQYIRKDATLGRMVPWLRKS
jgi:cytochrome b561